MRYTPYTTVLAARGFAGVRVRKVTLNGGFTCPNLDGSKGRGGCTYCDNRSFSPVAGARALPIGTQLREGVEFHRKRHRAEKFIAYFQPFSGTYAPLARLESLYREALAHPDVVGLSIGTRPDCIDAGTADLLERIGRETFLTLELGLQSAHDESLRRINRGHGFGEFAAAMDLLSGRGFDLCVHLILGLPGESAWHHRATAEALRAWEFSSVKIHPLHVVRGTVLHRQWQAGLFRPPTRAGYVEGLVDVLERLPASVGLQRFTGDAMGEMLIDPDWCRDKAGIARDMDAEFARRGSWQGWSLGQARPAAPPEAELARA